MKSWVKGEHPECFCEAQRAAEFIFPELKENEDECVKDDIKDVIQAAIIPEESKREMLDWLEKQAEQKQTWEPDAAQLIVIKSLIEDKNTSKVNKVILRGMLDEFKQFTNSQSSQFSDGNLLDPNKVIEWLKTKVYDDSTYGMAMIEKFKKDFGL